MLSDDSPLASPPDALLPIQKRSIDAIRYSLEFIDISYRRLTDELFEIASKRVEPPRRLKTSAFLDAWAVVDATHRLRTLVTSMRGYKKSAPSKQIFLRATTEIEALRHAMQHLSSEMSNLATAKLPVLGKISWIATLDRAKELFAVSALVSGQLLDTSGPVPHFDLPDTLDDGVMLVKLWVGNVVADLSATHRAAASMAATLERSFRKQFAGLPSTMNDPIMSMVLQLGERIDVQGSGAA